MTALKDSNTYPTRLKVTDEDLAALNLVRDAFHGEWNLQEVVAPPEIAAASLKLSEAGLLASVSTETVVYSA